MRIIYVGKGNFLKKGRQCRQPYVAHCNSKIQYYAPDGIHPLGAFVLPPHPYPSKTFKRN